MDVNEKLEALKQFATTIDGKNAFELLGVDQTAEDGAIRSAYFGLLKLYGADYFNAISNADDRKCIDDVNRKLRQAYDAIGKASKRAEYLASLNGSEKKEEPMDIAAVFQAEQAVSQARSLMERGDFSVAIQKLMKAQQLDPKSPEIKARLCYAQYMEMDVDAHGKRSSFAVKCTRESLEELAKELEACDYVRVYLGDIENLEGNSQKAIDWYKAALKQNPDNIQAKRAINLLTERAEKPKQDEKNKSFIDAIKDLFNKLNNIKLG